jgi:hypothetical protein
MCVGILFFLHWVTVVKSALLNFNVMMEMMLEKFNGNALQF